MAVRVQAEDFDIGAEIDALTGARRDIGAVVSFTGLVRDLPDGTLRALELEHYPGMTEAALTRIETEAQARWALQGVTILHRFGRLAPAERIVLVLTAAPHRHDAFEAAAFLMDYLKTRAPFWKKEHGADGGRWVDARQADDAAEARWGNWPR